MAKTKKKKVDKPDAPCAVCGSRNWCDCEWDAFVPSELAQIPQRVKRTHPVETTPEETLSDDGEQVASEEEAEEMEDA